jgi:hypothetical protein
MLSPTRRKALTAAPDRDLSKRTIRGRDIAQRTTIESGLAWGRGGTLAHAGRTGASTRRRPGLKQRETPLQPPHDPILLGASRSLLPQREAVRADDADDLAILEDQLPRQRGGGVERPNSPTKADWNIARASSSHAARTFNLTLVGASELAFGGVVIVGLLDTC